MSSKRALLASSLAISTTASWVVGNDQHPAFAEDHLAGMDADPDQEHIAQEAVIQYLNPISQVAEGNLAATVETKPLTYQVKNGDTLSSIGRFFGMPYEDLARFNRLENPDFLEEGQQLNIPLVRKWVRLKFGDTAERLAREYKTTKELLLHLNPDLDKATYAGQLVAVPQKVEIPKQSSPVPVEKENRKNQMKLVKGSVVPFQGSYVFRWPITGQITSNFGWRHGRMHKGIDIWNAAKSQTEIHAALGGTVVRAGYAGTYGNLVVIDHGGGWVTYYAHLSRIMVSKGEKVSTGQQLGYMGQTGRATGYHLHFEVRKNGKAINPLLVLK
ncbi:MULTISPECIES: M23 family metallopeptidase [Thermoactinomyces]|jgi:murein DD-endopeptidase MepM/ murein hydrolase activator NlpD|uniref:M23 family metallopeptidase n=1 Tax=Thermoactinomyces daqus TaxID=1329516 RepID=A0A7W2AHL7_9BACL|nr:MULTISPECIES: M23 family metallopeptidase [Thermoactinomyces]MBA4541859.1 M23 family metallopeptidase [Thermoactinomyces daqus]MBH8604208.1 M23 family metallopeptidase [Thermoactinomyces sp. CICC 10522]MBH8608070.1 M23 family metallopeptidase [Thermoactinomyces sp. CICC 10521]